MPRLETKTFQFEIKADGDGGDGSTFQGYGAVFHNIDGGADIIDHKAYDDHLAFFKTDGKVRDEHMVTTGKVLDASIDPAQGLFVKGRISDTASGRDQKTLLKDGVITRLSIGHYVIGREWLETPEEVKNYWSGVGYTPTETDLIRLGAATGDSWFGAVRLVTKAKPVEVSTTFNPMNERAQITGVKSAGQHGGLTFDAHTSQALATLEEFSERARKLFEKRAGEGRQLSAKHRTAFQRLSEQLAALLAAPTAATAQTTESPAAEGKSLDAVALFAQFQATCARLNGVSLN